MINSNNVLQMPVFSLVLNRSLLLQFPETDADVILCNKIHFYYVVER